MSILARVNEPAQPKGTAVIIATRGRPDIVKGLVAQLAEQTLPADHIFVVASRPQDVSGLDGDPGKLTVHIGRTGLTLQRNDGLALAGARFAYIAFFDDDFVPSRFWLERMTALFEARSDIAGITGVVLADGTTTAGIGPADAQTIVKRRESFSLRRGAPHHAAGYGGNAGCNMAFRYSAIGGSAFDEKLPLYAWLEDADFRGQIVRQGHVVRADALWGVHLGHKQGRCPGVQLGYSQIANAVYLARKGTVPGAYLANRAARNVISNAVRAVWPELYVDRRGRLLGNVIALADLFRGRITPERILGL